MRTHFYNFKNCRKQMVDNQDLKTIEVELQNQFIKTVTDRANLTLNIDEPNIKVYTTFQDSNMVVVAEAPCVEDLHPDDFIVFIENWADCIADINPLLCRVDKLAPIQGYPVGRTVAQCPWPLSNRINICARYPVLNWKPNEHLMVMSVRGAESVNHLTEADGDCCLATLFIAGWHFEPVLNSCDEISGTRITYLVQADAGGNIPQTLTNAKGPSSARGTIENVLSYIRQRKAEAGASQMSDADREALVNQLKAKFDAK